MNPADGCDNDQHRRTERPDEGAVSGRPSLAMVNAAEVIQTSDASAAMTSLVTWLQQTIVKPHPDLGRPGPVCPFVAPALQLRCLWIAVVHTPVSGEREMCEFISACLDNYDSFQSTVGAGSGLRTFVLAFPALRREQWGLIDRVHGLMKPAVVQRGLMLGEFSPESVARGVCNPNFFALRSPMPLFVLRQMVPADLIFLNNPADAPDRSVLFLRAYAKAMQGRLSSERAAEARQALATSEARLQTMQATADAE